MTVQATPSAVAAGRRWKDADQEYVRHQRVCRRWQTGRPCRECDRLDSATIVAARAYERALKQQTAP